MSLGKEGAIGSHPGYVWAMICACLIAVLLNILVIIVVVHQTRMKSSIDVLLTNLAASDVILAGVVMPLHFKNLAVSHGEFYGGNGVCKIVMTIPLMTVMSAILTIVALATDRYRNIVRQQTLRRRETLVTVVVIWISSFLIASPQIYEYSTYMKTEDNRTFTSCGSHGIAENFETIYASIVFAAAYLTPLLVLLICYIKILLYVSKQAERFVSSKAPTTSTVSGTDAQQPPTGAPRLNRVVTERKIRVTKMLIIIAGTFALLWTPYFILFALTEMTGTDDTADFGNWPHVVGRMMTLLSTITNPLFYLLFNRKFRYIACKVITCNRHVLQENDSAGAVTRTNQVAPSNRTDMIVLAPTTSQY